MRSGVRIGIAIAVAWLAAPSARAGVYISSEVRKDDFKLDDVKKLRGILLSLGLPPKPDDSDRPKYARSLAELKEKEKTNSLIDMQRADLGGLYLRFGQPRDAVRVLTEGNSQFFLVLCNLAVAYHELAVQDLDLNRFGLAVLTQQRALAAWPESWVGWSYEQWYVYRRVECLQLRLLELRYREARRADGKAAMWETVDDLFPGFKIVGPDGGYEAGRTALVSLDVLPPDALRLVRELMMAYPTDARLYWLFGELLNTGGRVEDAYQVCDDLVYGNQLSNVRLLAAHRRVLFDRVGQIRGLRDTPMFRNDKEKGLSPLFQEDLLWAFAPRSPFGVPIAGLLADEAGRGAASVAIENLQREERLGRRDDGSNLSLPTPPPAPDKPVMALPDWRVLAIGFAAGVVVTVVGGLQRSEWKRRRQLAQSRRQPVG